MVDKINFPHFAPSAYSFLDSVFNKKNSKSSYGIKARKQRALKHREKLLKAFGPKRSRQQDFAKTVNTIKISEFQSGIQGAVNKVAVNEASEILNDALQKINGEVNSLLSDVIEATREIKGEEITTTRQGLVKIQKQLKQLAKSGTTDLKVIEATLQSSKESLETLLESTKGISTTKTSTSTITSSVIEDVTVDSNSLEAQTQILRDDLNTFIPNIQDPANAPAVQAIVDSLDEDLSSQNFDPNKFNNHLKSLKALRNNFSGANLTELNAAIEKGSVLLENSDKIVDNTKSIKNLETVALEGDKNLVITRIIDDDEAIISGQIFDIEGTAIIDKHVTLVTVPSL